MKRKKEEEKENEEKKQEDQKENEEKSKKEKIHGRGQWTTRKSKHHRDWMSQRKGKRTETKKKKTAGKMKV